MTLQSPVVQKVDSAVRKVIGSGPAVLAISGGLDSMVLLESASRAAADITVATFDHGTGVFAEESVKLVARRASELGLACVIGRAARTPARESDWRSARMAFLKDVADRECRVIATAHNRDDQVETVFMRILREAGPRGLSGLFADSLILRPLLEFSRVELTDYVRTQALVFLEDPSNSNRAHMRNRVRHDLLPAIRQVQPDIDDQLLDIARKSTQWRREMDKLVEKLGADRPEKGELRVERDRLRKYDASSLRVIWPVLAARASVVMDRRGTHRAAEFTINGMTGGSIQLSGGVEILMRRDHLLLRRWQPQK
ncbi:MAG: tRNA lysidine(34) synthetase TilS [Gemmatimonadaceae bacterium]|nr:tRNA lysidine(34) synthetase TilS [Gemmatimonadaceae bacterium]